MDDNPAEREIVRQQVPGAAVPEMTAPEQFIRTIDHCGYFEVTTLSEDDARRTDMYRANAARRSAEEQFEDYGSYLRSLEMKAEIAEAQRLMDEGKGDGSPPEEKKGKREKKIK